MTISTRRSSVRSIRTMPTATASALAALCCALTSADALAGTITVRGPVFPIVIDVDKDGLPGGVTNPNTIQEVEFRGIEPGLINIAAVFFGDGAFSLAEFLSATEPPEAEFVGPTPDTVYDCQSADLDCDGDEDLLGASFEKFFCIKQNADGTFAAPTLCAQTTADPFSENCFALTDLTGDQCPDLVSVSNTFQSPNNALIQVFPNNGAGVFLTPTTITIPGATIAANAVGDIDHDGSDEVAVIRGTSSVSVLKRTAPGTLTPLNATTGLPLAPSDPFTLSEIDFSTTLLFEITLSDVNIDGNADILASNLNDIFVRPSLGNGTFGPVITLDGDSGTRNIAVADLNGDGTPEVLAINPNNDAVNLWRSTGPLQWGTKVDLPVGTSPSGVLVTDTNDDNLLDIVALNRVDGDAAIYLNNGAGNFFVPQRFAYSFPVAGGYTSVDAGDFNGDGHTDIFASTQRGDLDLFLNRADGSGLLQERINRRVTFNPFLVTTLPPPPGLPGGPRHRVAAGILNSDAINIRRYDAANPPTNPYTSVQVINSTGNIITSITTCDLNADNIADIAVTLAGSTPAAQVFLGDAAGLFGNPVALNLPTPGWDKFIVPSSTSGLPANRYYIADFQTGNVLPLTFAAGALSAGTAIPFGTNCTDFAMGDIDGDGIDDLITARTGATSGEVLVQTNITAPVPPPSFSVALPRNPAGIAVGDVNGDGKNDVIVTTTGPANQNQYAISILNSGTALDPNTITLHPAGERPARPILVDLHNPPALRSTNALSGPELIIPNRDATGFNFNASVIVLPNQINFAPPSPACRADFNTDGVVSTPDLVFFLGRFGQPATPGSPAARADFNGDGVVNTPDLVFFLGRFGQTCP